MATYWIIGSDGRTYGPVDAGTMERWIAESRVVATTQVGTSEQGPWSDATLVPELAAAFGAEPAQPTPAPGADAGAHEHAMPPAPPTAPVAAARMPADWPPSMVAVPQLVSGILNLLAAAGWLVTCFGVILTVPLAILGVHELLAYSRARTTKPTDYLDSAGRLAVFDICTLLAGNIGSAICGVVVLTQLSAARERAQAR
jgi:hypothetical protein